MKAALRSTDRDSKRPAVPPVGACSRCPACGSEECRVLEELGTYCQTMAAAGAVPGSRGARRRV